MSAGRSASGTKCTTPASRMPSRTVEVDQAAGAGPRPGSASARAGRRARRWPGRCRRAVPGCAPPRPGRCRRRRPGPSGWRPGRPRGRCRRWECPSRCRGTGRCRRRAAPGRHGAGTPGRSAWWRRGSGSCWRSARRAAGRSRSCAPHRGSSRRPGPRWAGSGRSRSGSPSGVCIAVWPPVRRRGAGRHRRRRRARARGAHRPTRGSCGVDHSRRLTPAAARCPDPRRRTWSPGPAARPGGAAPGQRSTPAGRRWRRAGAPARSRRRSG